MWWVLNKLLGKTETCLFGRTDLEMLHHTALQSSPQRHYNAMFCFKMFPRTMFRNIKPKIDFWTILKEFNVYLDIFSLIFVIKAPVFWGLISWMEKPIGNCASQWPVRRDCPLLLWVNHHLFHIKMTLFCCRETYVNPLPGMSSSNNLIWFSS